MYESQYVCHFFRLWGWNDGSAGKPTGPMLGNMQNALDSAVGDVTGWVNSRYFIIEFKQKRSGFAAERKAKPDREALYQTLLKKTEKTARSLSVVGHFACYSRKNALVFEPYFRAATRPSVPTEVAKYAASKYLLTAKNVAGGPWNIGNFDEFYGEITDFGPILDLTYPNFYEEGLGLNCAGFYEYLTAMYAHINFDDEDEFIFGKIDSDGKLYAAIVTVEDLVITIRDNLREILSMADTLQPSTKVRARKAPPSQASNKAKPKLK